MNKVQLSSRSIWRSELSENLDLLLLYHILTVLLSICAVSFVAFFHFLLDHSLQVIEDWLYAHCWIILAVVRFPACLLVYRLSLMRRGLSFERLPATASFEGLHRFRFEIVALCLVVIVTAFFLMPEMRLLVGNEHINPFRNLFFKGTYFAMDAIVLYSLPQREPGPSRRDVTEFICFLALTYAASLFLFSAKPVLTLLPSFHFACLYWISVTSGRGVTGMERKALVPFSLEVCAYIVIVVLLPSYLFSIDPFWYPKNYSVTERDANFLYFYLALFPFLWPFIWRTKKIWATKV